MVAKLDLIEGRGIELSTGTELQLKARLKLRMTYIDTEDFHADGAADMDYVAQPTGGPPCAPLDINDVENETRGGSV
ncbi:hypothetical protein EVAR_14296_1 [Eumeta japonica]|uniref:Uncharacterized protein n=1 Tax=Eumeta variegata TaxID=151549 RepID=A0A4C1UM19_EUMVA|nr:hypothetical protein EVAR_14296_1 [Eumeta japonica]